MPALARVAVQAGERQVYYRRIRVYGARLTNGQLVALSGSGSSIDVTGLAHDTGIVPAATGDEANGNVVLLHSGAASARYLLVDVADASLPAIDIGILAAGPLWRLGGGLRRPGMSRLMLRKRERRCLP